MPVSKRAQAMMPEKIKVPVSRLVPVFSLSQASTCHSPKPVRCGRTIAAGLAELRSSHTRFFDELQQAAGTPDAAWECHIAWYEETHAEIAALRTRAASYGLKSDPTADALALLDQSVAELEQAHAEGLSRGEIPMLRTMFDSQLRMLIELEEAKKRTPAEVTP